MPGISLRVPVGMTAVFVTLALAVASRVAVPTAGAQQATPTATPPPGFAIERIAPPFQTASLSQLSFPVDVTVENVSGLGAYETLITYDSAVVTFVSAADGLFLGSSGRSEICPPPLVQPLLGTMRRLHFGCGTVGQPPAPSGSGVLATIQFAPVAAGTADLLLEPSLSDTLGSPIGAVAYNGQTQINTGPTPTPTFTLTPTATSTPCPGGACPTPTPVPCSPTLVAVEPAALSGHPGVVLDVPVAVHNVCTLGAFQFTLAYDPALLAFTDAAPGAFLASSGRSVQCTSPELLASAVRINCVTLGSPPPDGPSGNGTLATLSFVPIATGTTALALQEAILVAPDASTITTASTDGSASITSCSTCTTVTPTPTASPSPTPTATLTPVPTLTQTPCAGTCLTDTFTPTTVIAMATPTPAPSPATVRIDPSALSGQPGSVLAVPVRADNVVDLGGFGFQLSWDPALLALQSVTLGPLLESSGRASFCDVNTSAGPSSVLYSCSTLGALLPGATGSGVLGFVNLIALAPGTSTLTPSQVTLVTPAAQPIPLASVQGGNATISVCSGACPTPTITQPPTATSTPGAGGATGIGISQLMFNVVPGDTFTVDVLASNVADLASFQFTFEYNSGSPRFVDFVSVQAGTFLGSTGRPVFCPPPTVTVFNVQYGCVTSGTSALGSDGWGVLATLTFRANNVGSNSLFGLSAAEMSDPLANNIPVQRGPLGTVNSAPVAPTSTPTATATAPLAVARASGAQAQALQSALALSPVTPLQGDVNGDCAVNIADVQDVASRYGATLGTSKYLPSRDLVPALRDGVIAIDDLQYVLGRTGTKCADPPVTATPTVTNTPVPTPTPCGADANADGIPDCWEVKYSCLNALQPAPNADPDGDGLTTWQEYELGTNPCSHDTDGDGCRDGAEIGPNHVLGGDRDPLNRWDLGDVPVPPLPDAGTRNGAITIADVIAVVSWIGTADGGPANATGRQYNQDGNANGIADGAEYDRTASSAPGKPWRLGPPNGVVTIADAIAILGSIGDHC